jgi:tetratricopeptide (TPR) repeat protein
LFSLTGLVSSQTVDSAPDFSDVEEFLQKSRMERQQLITEQAKTLLAQLNLLAKNADLLEAYKNAYENVNFEGTAHDRTKELAWEKSNAAVFKDNTFLWTLRAHVQYLIATMQKVLGEDETAVQMISQWIDSFPDTNEKFEAVAQSQLLKGGISGSVFLKAAIRPTPPTPRPGMLPQTAAQKKPSAPTDFLRGLANWYQGDLANLPEIQRVNIIGYYRTQRNPLIFNEWQKNIAMEQTAAERGGLTAKKEAFLLNRRPWLLWQMGKDYALFKQPRKAVDIMVTAIKESPHCSDYDAIVAEIIKVITEARKAAAKAVAPEPASVPAKTKITVNSSGP